MAANPLSVTVGFVEQASFHTVGNAFAMTRVVKQPGASGTPASLPPLPRKVPRSSVIYECPECEARFLGEQRCDQCQRFCRRVGPGGPCPSCDEPIALVDLLPEMASS